MKLFKVDLDSKNLRYVEDYYRHELHRSKHHLCLPQKGAPFVSTVNLTEPDFSLPPNCDYGCLYVDHVQGRICIPINQLKELYMIAEGVE